MVRDPQRGEPVHFFHKLVSGQLPVIRQIKENCNSERQESRDQGNPRIRVELLARQEEKENASQKGKKDEDAQDRKLHATPLEPAHDGLVDKVQDPRGPDADRQDEDHQRRDDEDLA